ncbi:MAG: EVE domain-containing protein [Rhodospirillales bacterium]|nr:EVE domain-containing protein [Alphaproteobacteria bacterium]USO03828.1 MAG: EVE domain-containing protein [Rhodospirillales bacterium]
MNYWLVKSEPYKWSWDQQKEKGACRWMKPVRNYQARNNLKLMEKGDRAFFYHSNEGKEIVGILEIMREHYPDPLDETGKFVTVDVAPLKDFSTPVSLTDIKGHEDLAGMSFIRQSRLSVSPVTEKEWNAILKMGGL